MSMDIRGHQPSNREANEDQQADIKWGGIRATARAPLSHAALGLASVVIAGGAAAQDGALPQIDVISDNGNQSYQATNQTITRLPTPLLDTPQTVNVVTAEVMRDQQVGCVGVMAPMCETPISSSTWGIVIVFESSVP